MSFKSKRSDPTEDIKKAVEKLAAFNHLNDSLVAGSLEKTIGLMKQFLSVKFGEKGRLEEEKEILSAIDTLKSNYLLWEKLQQGTPQQQKLATSIEGVIQKYNAIIEQAQQKPLSFTDKIAAYLAKHQGCPPLKELGKIHFPFQIKVQKDFYELDQEKKITQKIESPQIVAASKKIADLSQVVVPKVSLPVRHFTHLSKQAVELFHMKVIALIEKNGLLSNVEARQAIRTSYLQTYLHPDLTTCTAICTINPYPGQTIVVNGSFEKSPRTGDYTIPNSKCFQLTLTSYQTGFPHPLQHTGSALPDLIPPYPHNLARLPLLKPLYEGKQKIAHELLENEKRISKAKQLQQLKKEAFEQDLDCILQLHAQTAIAFVSHGKVGEDDIAGIRNFYEQLTKVPNPYHYLSETHHIINENFSVRPQEKLKQQWMTPQKGEFYAEKILVDEVDGVWGELDDQLKKATNELEKSTIFYMKIVGETLAGCSRNLILQNLAEGMGLVPPQLSDFEKKMQVIAFKQLRNFISDLNVETIELDRSLLLERLILEYTLLESSFQQIESRDPDAQIVKELENYYQT